MKYIAIVLVLVGIGFAGMPPLANAQQATMTNEELTALIISLQARIETLESMLNVQAPQAPTPPQEAQATSTITQTITPPKATPSIFDVARCRGSIRCAKP